MVARSNSSCTDQGVRLAYHVAPWLQFLNRSVDETETEADVKNAKVAPGAGWRAEKLRVCCML